MLKSKPTNIQLKNHKYRPYVEIKSEPTLQILNPFWHFGPRHLNESLWRWRRRRWWVSSMLVYGCVALDLHPSRCPCSCRSTLVQTSQSEIGWWIGRFIACGSLPLENRDLRLKKSDRSKPQQKIWFSFTKKIGFPLVTKIEIWLWRIVGLLLGEGERRRKKEERESRWCLGLEVDMSLMRVPQRCMYLHNCHRYSFFRNWKQLKVYDSEATCLSF